MKRLCILVLGLVLPALVAAPAHASAFVGTPSSERVEVALTHAEVVSIANDGGAPSRLCAQLLFELEKSYGLTIFNSPVNIFTCPSTLTTCAKLVVAGRYQRANVVWRRGGVTDCNTAY